MAWRCLSLKSLKVAGNETIKEVEVWFSYCLVGVYFNVGCSATLENRDTSHLCLPSVPLMSGQDSNDKTLHGNMHNYKQISQIFIYMFLFQHFSLFML